MSNLSTKSIVKSIEENAVLNYPNEACGLIVKPKLGKKIISIPCQNIADDPSKRFVISPVDFAGAEDLGEVIGVWHTHIEHSSEPSMADIAACNSSELEWLILDVYKRNDKFEFGNIRCLHPEIGELAYTGRPYVYGVYDCFSLAKEWYNREMKLDINFVPKGYPEIEELSNQKNLLLLEGAIEAGFEIVATQPPEIGDLFLFNVSSDFPNHVGVYIGDSRILHHCMNRLSETSVYPRSYWQKNTYAHLRWKGLM